MKRIISLIAWLWLFISWVENLSWDPPHEPIHKQKSEFEAEIDDIISIIFELQLSLNFPSCGELVSQNTKNSIPLVQNFINWMKAIRFSDDVKVNQYKWKLNNIIIFQFYLFYHFIPTTIPIRYLICDLGNSNYLDEDCIFFIPFTTDKKAIHIYKPTTDVDYYQYISFLLEIGGYSISMLSDKIVWLLQCMILCYYIYFVNISENKYDFTLTHNQVNNTFMGYLLSHFCYQNYQFSLSFAFELRGFYNWLWMIVISFAILQLENLFGMCDLRTYWAFLDKLSCKLMKENRWILAKYSAFIVAGWIPSCISIYLMELMRSSDTVVIILNLPLFFFGSVNAYKKMRIKMSITYIVFLTFYWTWITNFKFVASRRMMSNSDYILFFSKIIAIHVAVGTLLYMQGQHGSRFFIPNKFRSIKLLNHIKDLQISQLAVNPPSWFYCWSSLHLPSPVSESNYLNYNVRPEVRKFVWQQGPVYIKQEKCTHKYHFEWAIEVYSKNTSICSNCNLFRPEDMFEFDD